MQWLYLERYWGASYSSFWDLEGFRRNLCDIPCQYQYAAFGEARERQQREEVGDEVNLVRTMVRARKAGVKMLIKTGQVMHLGKYKMK